MPKSNKPPSYRRHKASKQAIVTIGGRDIYLGSYGSAESRELYSKLLAGIVQPDDLVRRPPPLSPRWIASPWWNYWRRFGSTPKLIMSTEMEN